MIYVIYPINPKCKIINYVIVRCFRGLIAWNKFRSGLEQIGELS